MNPFTTDHPLASQPSLFDAKAHPWFSAAGRILILALCFTPAILVALYNYFTSDLGADDPFPDPWFALAFCTVLSFAIGLICATATMMAYRLLARIWKNVKP